MTQVPLMPRTLTPFYDHWREGRVDRRRVRCGADVLTIMEDEARSPDPVVPPSGRIGRALWARLWRERLETLWPGVRRLAAARALVADRLVFDLVVTPGRLDALVGDRRLQRTTVHVRLPTDAEKSALLATCAGLIPSITALLDGPLPAAAQDPLAARALPAAGDLDARCTCEREQCVHAAAALYGLAVRLDEDPAPLFRLRAISPAELYDAGAAVTLRRAAGPARARRIVAALRRAGAAIGP